MVGSQRSTFLPDSFFQRGVYVSFRTHMMRYVRLRRSRAQALELLVPGLSGNLSIYVIPYKAVGDVISLEVFDRALNDQFANMIEVNPLVMRAAVMKVARTGLAGPHMARVVREEEALNNANGAKILLDLLCKAIDQVGKGDLKVEHVDEAFLSSREGIMQLRTTFHEFAQELSQPSEEIIKYIEDWARMILPVGSPDGTAQGHLLALYDQLEDFAKDLQKWLISEPAETAEMAQLVAVAAREIRGHAKKRILPLHNLGDDVKRPLAKWALAKKKIQESVIEISSILDGWEIAINEWDKVKTTDRYEQRHALKSLAQFLPVLPNEILSAEDKFWSDFRRAQARWMKGASVEQKLSLDQDAQANLNKFLKEDA